MITNRTIEGRFLQLFDWSCTHNLKLNVLKTKEMVFDFRRRTNVVLPLTINGQDIENFQCFKFLGTTISANVKVG